MADRQMGDIEPAKEGYIMFVGYGGWLVLNREAMINLQKNIERQIGPGWISVKESLPLKNKVVLVAYLENGHYRCVKAEYIPAKSREVDFDTDGEFNGETYDPETDNHYWPEGWYECPQDNGGDDSYYWQIDHEVTHWMPLPVKP